MKPQRDRNKRKWFNNGDMVIGPRGYNDGRPLARVELEIVGIRGDSEGHTIYSCRDYDRDGKPPDPQVYPVSDENLEPIPAPQRPSR